jgi:hypothetical protein
MTRNHIDEYVSSGTSPTREDSRKNPSMRQNILVRPEPLLLDIHGAAHALSSSVWAVRSLLWSHAIPHIKIGRKFLIDPMDLRAFIQREKEAA